MFGQLFPSGSNRGKIFSNTTAQLVGKFFGAGTTFLLSFVLARQFGASGFGDFIKITTFVSFFFLIADFGLNALYLQRKDAQALATLLGLRIIGGISLIGLALSILAFLPQTATQGYTPMVRIGIILFAPAILFQSLITSANAIFQKHLRYDAATIATGAGSVVTVSLLGIIWLSKWNVGGAILGSLTLLLGSLTTAVVALWFAHRVTPLRVQFSSKALIPFFISAIPLGLTLISNVIYAHADSVILTLTRPTEDVGTYGLAYKIFETLLVLPTFFMNAMYPLLLQANNEREKFISLIRKSAAALMFLSVLLFVAVWITAPYILIIRSDFAASIVYLRILAISLPFFFLSSLTMWILITRNMQWILVAIYVFGMALNIGANIWLTPHLGPLASSWITVISEGLILLCCGIVVFQSLSNTAGHERIH